MSYSNQYGGYGDDQLRVPGGEFFNKCQGRPKADDPASGRCAGRSSFNVAPNYSMADSTLAETHTNPFSTPQAPPTPGSGSSYFPRDESSAPLASTAGAGAGGAIPMSMSNMSMASRPGASNRDSMAYQNIPSEQYWNEPSRFSTGPLARNPEDDDYGAAAGATAGRWKGSGNKKKWIICGVILGVLAVAGIVAGVVVSQTSSGGSSSGGGSGSSGSGSSGDGEGDSSDPSNFSKDSRLHQSFWAMAYTPQASANLTDYQLDRD